MKRQFVLPEIVETFGGSTRNDFHNFPKSSNSPGRNICRYKDRSGLRLELVERRQSFVLRHLTMKWNCGEAECAQHQRNADSGMARRAEDDEAVAGQLVEDVHEIEIFVLGGDEDVKLLQLVDGLVAVGDFHLDGILQRRPLQLLHLLRHRRAEQECSALPGNHFEDLIELHLEVHVEDAVGLVHHEIFDGLQAEAFRVRQVIHQTARCRDDDVWLLGQLQSLRHHVHAAYNHCTLDTNRCAWKETR